MKKSVKRPNIKELWIQSKLRIFIVETDAARLLPPPVASKPKDERHCRPVATVCHHCCCRLPGLSPTGISPIGHDNQHCWEAATWAHHLQGQHEHILIVANCLCCVTAMKKPLPYRTRLMMRTTSAFRNCDYSPPRHRHRAMLLSLA